MNRIAIRALVLAFVVAVALAGCSPTSGQSSSAAAASSSSSEAAASVSQSSTGAGELAPGVYTVDFDTDSSMFHVNEADEGTGELTVADDGTMTVHIRLASKNILNLYAGLASDAENDAANLIEPTTDTVAYKDGYEEEVYGFDVPVPALDEEFDVAIIGTKGTWYDHKVSVSNPQAK